MIAVFLPAAIAFYLFYPLLTGSYVYGSPEYELYRSFMVNFIETLKHFELPIWNEYVGSGTPAMLFSHYPITQNTIVYMLFGFNDLTFYATKCLNVFILLITFVYAARFLRLSYLVVLSGAIVYLSINFVIRFIIADTIGNLFILYPLLMFLMIKVLRERKPKDVLIFSLCYIGWLSGNHITYVFPHVIMMLVVYATTVIVDHGRNTFSPDSLKRYVGLAVVMFVLPVLTVLYQYYFAYDVLSHSNRVGQEGLIVSPLAGVAWRQLLLSVKASSYLWMALVVLVVYTALKLLPWTKNKPLSWQLTPGKWRVFVWALLVAVGIVMIFEMELISRSSVFADYFPIINSTVFRISFLLYLAVLLLIHRKKKEVSISFNDCVIFLIYVSLLSYYFFSPANNAGYDYDFFRELSAPFQVIFTFVVLYSSREHGNNNILKIVVFSAIVLYLIRSHFTIPLLRFTGIIWYSVRDGSVFSFFFALLFMFGLSNLLSDIRGLFGERKTQVAEYVKFAFLTLLVLLMVRDSYAKFYDGQSNRLILPNKQDLAKDPKEKLFIDRGNELASLNEKIVSLKGGTEHFFRLFTADIPDWYFLAGYWQQYKLYDAAIYDGTIPRGLATFFDDVILNKPPLNTRDFKNLLQCPVFARHVHEGFEAKFEEIPYSPHFTLLLIPNDLRHIKEKSMEFFWDLMQVKYLVVGPGLSDVIKNSFHLGNYAHINHYPKLNVDLYAITKRKSYSRIALLPLEDEKDYEGMLRQSNSADINVLQSLYAKLVYPDDAQEDFAFSNIQRGFATRSYDIRSKKNALLIEFESVNHNWKAMMNGNIVPLQKVFHNLKGVKIAPGLNKLTVSYHLKYFGGLFFLAVASALTYLVLAVRYLCVKDPR